MAGARRRKPPFAAWVERTGLLGGSEKELAVVLAFLKKADDIRV
jgi:hypothetical protein